MSKNIVSIVFFHLLFFFCKSSFAEPLQYKYEFLGNEFLVGSLTPNQTRDYTIETVMHTNSADTILYVFEKDNSGNWVYKDHNDDCGMVSGQSCPSLGQGSNFRSKLSIELTKDKNYIFLVRAYSISTGIDLPGNASIYVDYVDSSSTPLIFGEFGGREFEVNSSSFANYDPTNVYNYEVVSIPGTTTNSPNPTYNPLQSIIMAIGCNTGGTVLALRDYGGRGYHSGISSSNVCKIVIASGQNSGNSTSRTMNFVINDNLIPGRDQDQDGVGLKLEETFHTCDRRNQTVTLSGTTISCDEKFTGTNTFRVYNMKDTDRDGISDEYEIFGKGIFVPIPNSNPPTQEYQFADLRAWGAEPSEKDIFLEVDFHNKGQNINPISTSFAQNVQNVFSDFPTQDLNAFQRQLTKKRVRIHIDLGKDPSPNAPVYEKVLYGDWGGSQVYTQVNPFPDPNNPSKSMELTVSEGVFYDKGMSEVRKGIFMHVYYHIRSGDTAGCFGQASLNNPWFRVGTVTNSPDCPVTFSHELGHSIGLRHWGLSSWGAINGKPNYRSLMNYAQNVATFSSSDLGPSSILNPSNINELIGLGISLDPTYLQNSPFFLSTAAYSPGNTQTPIDWDKDGDYKSNIRAPIITAQDNGIFSLGSINKKTLASGEPKQPELIYLNPPNPNPGVKSELYAFYLQQDQGKNKIFYKHAESVKVPNDTGSCLNSTGLGDKIGESCTNWSSEFALDCDGFTDDISSFTALYVSRLDNSDFDRIIFAYVRGGNLYTKWTFDHNTGTNHPLSCSSGDEILVAQSFIDPKDPTKNKIVQGKPELSFYQSNSDTPQKVVIFYRVNNEYKWKELDTSSPTTSNWNWTNEKNVSVNGTNEQGAIPPSVMWWPSPGVPDGMLCGVFTKTVNSDNQLRFLCLDRTDDNNWIDLTSNAFGPEQSLTTLAQPSLVFRYRKFTDGVPLDPPNDGIGQFWLTNIVARTNNNSVTIYTPRTYISRKLSALTLPPDSSSFTPQTPMFTNNWSYTTSGSEVLSSISVVSHLEVSALRAFGMRNSTQTQNGQTVTINNLEFYPFFDGTYDAQLIGDSDIKVMDRKICLSIRQGVPGWQSNTSIDSPTQFCGDPSTAKWGY